MDNTPKRKMGKRARRQLDASARRTWQVSPVTRTKQSKKIYDRKKRRRDDESPAAFLFAAPYPGFRKSRRGSRRDVSPAADAAAFQTPPEMI